MRLKEQQRKRAGASMSSFFEKPGSGQNVSTSWGNLLTFIKAWNGYRHSIQIGICRELQNQVSKRECSTPRICSRSNSQRQDTFPSRSSTDDEMRLICLGKNR